jgi:sensor histidine kinase YesM
MEKRSVMKQKNLLATKIAVVLFLLTLMAVGYLPALQNSNLITTPGSQISETCRG